MVTTHNYFLWWQHIIIFLLCSWHYDLCILSINKTWHKADQDGWREQLSDTVVSNSKLWQACHSPGSALVLLASWVPSLPGMVIHSFQIGVFDPPLFWSQSWKPTVNYTCYYSYFQNSIWYLILKCMLVIGFFFFSGHFKKLDIYFPFNQSNHYC